MISAAFVTDVGYYLGGGGAPESYYLGTAGMQEPMGRWSGTLAEKLRLAAEEAGVVSEVQADDMHHLYGEGLAPDGSKVGNRPGQPKTLEERLASWVKAHPSALPEDVAAKRASLEDSQRKVKLGVDLTFNLPKSFTIALTAVRRMELDARRTGDVDAADGWGRLHAELEADVYAANAEALRVVASRTVAQIAAEGKGRAPKLIRGPELAVASFLQHTSRSIDPHVHIHNVIYNKVLCTDGRYRAIDGESLLDDRGLFSAVADRALAERWAARGIQSALRPDGVTRELVDVTEAQRELFSERSSVITGRLKEEVEKLEESYGRELTGREVWDLKRWLTVQTRDAKTHDGESEEELYARWQREASAAVGEGLEPLAQVLRARVETHRPVEAETFSPHAVCSAAVAVCSAARASWRAADLAREIELRLPVLGGLEPEQVTALLQGLVEETLASDMVVQTAGREAVPVPVELQVWGESYDRPASQLYAAAGTLMAEEAVRRAAVQRGHFHLEDAAVEAWLAEKGQDLSLDQARVNRGLAVSDAGIAVEIGPAGAGKSYGIRRFSQMWQDLSGGGRLQGLAVSQQAANVLAKEGVAITANVRQWLEIQGRIAAGRGQRGDLRYVVHPRDVVMVDEASMVSTADVLEVLEVVERAGARLMLTGDPRQLSAVQAGGAMGLLEDRADVFSLSEVRRFHAGWEGPASLSLRDGDPAALREYDRHGRLVTAADVDGALRSAARAAAADIVDGKQTLVVAATNEQAARVAALVREQLQATGWLEPGGPEVELREGGMAGRDDLVMGRLNDHAAGLVNRGIYTVAGVRGDGGLTVVDAHGVMLQADPEYVAEHLSSAFGSTVHAAQGATVDTCHLVTDGRLDAAALYVAMTRGKERNTAHVAVRVDEEAPESRPKAVVAVGDEPQLTTDGGTKSKVVQAYRDDPKASARQVLSDAMKRSGEAVSATVELERDDARLASASHLLGRREDGIRVACRGRLERWLDELAMDGTLRVEDRARLREDQGTEHVSRLLRALEQGGHDPREELGRAIANRRGFTDARSVAQVVSKRITARVDVAEPAEEAVVPAGMTPGVTAYLQELAERTQERRRVLGTETAQEPPEWAVRALGEVPEDAADRLEWEDRAGKVAGYREATGWDHPLRPIGDAPGVSATELRAEWHVAWGALGRPESERAEALMTDGQLMVRRDAWRRAQEWAPEYGDPALQRAELDAARARQEAILAEDEATAERLWAEHEARAEAARVLADSVQARDEWVEETATTRSVGERADAEWARRGLPEKGREPDRVAAQEWLEVHRAVDVVEDPHRVVTETDVHVPERDADLADRVEERATDAVVELPQPRVEPERAQRHAETHPDDAVREALAWQAKAVRARVDDQTSLEESSPAAAVVEPYDVADGYYVPAARVQQDVLVDD